MEFVNGSSISARTKFDIHDAVDMYFQIKVIIEDLAEIGISHNGITEETIMLDVDGRYWLVDGAGWSFVDDLPRDVDHTPSTWMYHAPHFSVLRERSGESCQQINGSQSKNSTILDGNLYSLQAVILEQLVSFEGTDVSLRRGIRDIHREIDQIYRNGDHRRFVRMKQPLLNIWFAREAMMNNYFRNHPELNELEMSIFSKLKVGNDVTMLMEPDESTTEIAKDSNPCLVACTVI